VHCGFAHCVARLRLLHTMPGWLDGEFLTSHSVCEFIGCTFSAVAYLDLDARLVLSLEARDVLFADTENVISSLKPFCLRSKCNQQAYSTSNETKFNPLRVVLSR
jgi:hypothetical protein